MSRERNYSWKAAGAASTEKGDSSFYIAIGPQHLGAHSAGLNCDEREGLARFIMRIKHDLGIAMIWIEHDMQIVVDFTNRLRAAGRECSIATLKLTRARTELLGRLSQLTRYCDRDVQNEA